MYIGSQMNGAGDVQQCILDLQKVSIPSYLVFAYGRTGSKFIAIHSKFLLSINKKNTCEASFLISISELFGLYSPLLYFYYNYIQGTNNGQIDFLTSWILTWASARHTYALTYVGSAFIAAVNFLIALKRTRKDVWVNINMLKLYMYLKFAN